MINSFITKCCLRLYIINNSVHFVYKVSLTTSESCVPIIMRLFVVIDR